jgi:hypothetical protein
MNSHNWNEYNYISPEIKGPLDNWQEIWKKIKENSCITEENIQQKTRSKLLRYLEGDFKKVMKGILSTESIYNHTDSESPYNMGTLLVWER